MVPFVRGKSGTPVEQFWGPSGMVGLVTPVASTMSMDASRVVVVNESLPVRYADEPPAPVSSKRKVHFDVEEEEDSEKEETKEVGGATVSTWKSWAPFSSCRKGVFAVLKIDYDGKGGISVMKVLALEEEEESFYGHEYLPSNVYTSTKCIRNFFVCGRVT